MNEPARNTFEVGQTYRVEAGSLIIGTNVRSDPRASDKAFVASIKVNGVLEPITAYVDPAGSLVVYRGQRRTLAAAAAGTPDGLVPVRVVAAPDDAERITSQLVENVHRSPMRVSEERDAVEQLALLGVSAAQITKRTALPRKTVDAALAVVASETTKRRMDEHGLTLDQAAAFAEFEGDERALASLEQAASWGRSIDHAVQRLRDERAERAAIREEVSRLREQGFPALDPDEVPEQPWSLRLDSLVTNDGTPVDQHAWAEVSGAAIYLRPKWAPAGGTDQDEGDGEDNQRLVPVWICLDPAAAGLHRPGADTKPAGPAATEAETEARAEERRQVVANNKAWRSAESVRRAWLAAFITRRSVPAGAEALICEAVVTGHHSLAKAMSDSHRFLRSLTDANDGDDFAATETCRRLATEPTTGKAATLRTLSAVIAAWEAGTSVHTWRNPSAWDRRVMVALTEWGYQPSDVEVILTAPAGAPCDEVA